MNTACETVRALYRDIVDEPAIEARKRLPPLEND
jgi:hypothetical protein